MTPDELDLALDELETRVERLRALYEQYFIGIEKVEPLVARKDVDRRIWLLRREQIRNTGKRFRLQMTIQRYNTFQQYWMRICREIENGTYTRHLLKAQKLASKGELLTIAAKRRARHKITRPEEARDASLDPPATDGLEALRLLEDELASTLDALDPLSDAGARMDAELGTSQPPGGFSEPKRGAEARRAMDQVLGPSAPPPSPMRGPRRHAVFELEPDEIESLERQFDRLELGVGIGAPEPGAAQRHRPDVAVSPFPRRPVDPSAPMGAAPHDARRSLPALPRPPVISGPPRPAVTPAAAHAKPAEPTRPDALPPRAVPSNSLAPNTGLGSRSGPRPPRPGPREAALGHRPLGTEGPAAPAPVRAGVPMQGGPREDRTVTRAAPPAPNPEALPAPKTALARTAVAGSARLGHGSLLGPNPLAASATITEERAKEIHARLVSAKKQTNESTDVTFESLRKTLAATEARLRAQHGANRRVDFEVVIKNGKAVLKPTVR